MSTKNSKVVPATAQDVREWATKNPKKVPEIALADRGRMPLAVVEAFNKDAKSRGMRYEPGAKATMALTYKARNNRRVTVHLPKSEIRALAGKAGTRGRFSQKDLEFAAEVYASR